MSLRLAARHDDCDRRAVGGDAVFVFSRYVGNQNSTVHCIAYRNNLAYPAKLPLYFAADEWVLSTWWQKTAGLNLASPQ